MAAKFFDHLLNQIGLPISNATVTVRVADATPGAGALATIWSGDGSPVISGSTLTTDAKGYFEFWAADGKYDLTVTGTGLTTRIFADVEVADVSERNAADADWKIGTATINTVNFDNTSSDVALSRSAANTLQLATGDKFLTQNVNNIRYANDFAGATAGAKIVAAIADLPSTGGIVDARGLEGAQTIVADIFAGVTKPVRLLLGAATYTVTGFAAGDAKKIGIEIPSNVSILGLGHEHTIIKQANSDAQWAYIRSKASASNIRLEGFTLDGNVANNAGDNQAYGIHLQSGTADTVIRDVLVRDMRGFNGSIAVAIAGSAVVNVLVENNTIRNVGASGRTSDGIFMAGSQIRILGNFIDTATDTGIVVESATNNPIVSNNTITGMAQGIAVSGVSGTTGFAVTGNTILSSGAASNGAALRVQKTSGTASTRGTVSGNAVRSVTGSGNNTRGIWVNDASYVDISSNIVTGFSTVDGLDGVRLTLVNHFTFTNNVISNNGGFGLAMLGSKYGVIGVNAITNNNEVRATNGTSTNDGIRVEDSGGTVSESITIVGNLATDSRAGGSKTQERGLILAGGSTNILVASNDFRFNRQTTGYSSTASGNVRRGFNLTEDTANSAEYIDSPRLAGNIYVDNNTALAWLDSGGSARSILALTNDASNITRMRAGVDAGGIQFTNQAASTAWALLSASGLSILGGTALATSNQTGTGNLVLHTSPTFVTKLTTPRVISSGTALVAGDFALSAGWGTTASVGTVTGTDLGWQITVTSSGTGQGANPTLTLTFKDGTFTNAPICISKMVGGTGTVTNLTEAPTATTNVITFNGTPVAASTYIIAGHTIGR